MLNTVVLKGGQGPREGGSAIIFKLTSRKNLRGRCCHNPLEFHVWYNMFVEITDLSDFAYYGSIYKLLDGTQVYSSATTECVRQLGPKATIAKIESYNEYSGVNTALLDLEKVDSYWLNGRLGNIPQNATYIQWGRCQPGGLLTFLSYSIAIDKAYSKYKP